VLDGVTDEPTLRASYAYGNYIDEALEAERYDLTLSRRQLTRCRRRFVTPSVLRFVQRDPLRYPDAPHRLVRSVVSKRCVF